MKSKCPSVSNVLVSVYLILDLKILQFVRRISGDTCKRFDPHSRTTSPEGTSVTIPAIWVHIRISLESELPARLLLNFSTYYLLLYISLVILLRLTAQTAFLIMLHEVTSLASFRGSVQIVYDIKFKVLFWNALYIAPLLTVSCN